MLASVRVAVCHRSLSKQSGAAVCTSKLATNIAAGKAVVLGYTRATAGMISKQRHVCVVIVCMVELG